MGIKMSLEEANAQAEGVAQLCKTQVEGYEALQRAIYAFELDSESLKGKAYDSARAFFREVLLPLAEGGQLYIETLSEATATFVSDYQSQVDSRSWDEEDLRQYIQDETAAILRLEELQQQLHSHSLPESIRYANRTHNDTLLYWHRYNKRYYENILSHLLDYHTYSATLFSQLASLEARIQTGISQVNGSWDANLGVFKIPQDMTWTYDIKAQKEYREAVNTSLSNRSEEMSRQNLTRAKQILYQTIAKLQADGWDKEAILAYIQSTSDIPVSKKGNDYFQELKGVSGDTHKVGSATFTAMYRASTKETKEKLAFLLDKMGAQIDQNHFLQLRGSYSFDSELDPNAEFWVEFRKDVSTTYNTSDGLNADELGQKLHLFRSYIGRQNLDYLRRNYPNEQTDYDRLLAYAEAQDIELDYTSDATYHNRVKGEFDYTRNMKVQLPNSGDGARMSEFIIDLETGNFVSEWDAYNQHRRPDGTYDSDPGHYSLDEQYRIANTESFNYGMPKGQHDVPKQWNKSHDRLDAKHPADNDIREQATRGDYPSPIDYNEEGREGTYVDIVKKEADYEAWQQVPRGEKARVYQEYLAWARANGNRGFSNYLSSK